MDFPTDITSIEERIEAILPTKYASTRNYLDGAVTYLSPYISRGVISTKYVFESIVHKGYDLHSAQKLIQELAWRDYWQQVWIAKKEEINFDLKYEQKEVSNHQIASAILDRHTGIESIDKSIHKLYTTGYMHNHMRMYVASIACNIAQSHWIIPAKWMYYHLLDADWASNALSWQWVAGSNANKKYVANQENINKYTKTNQYNTFLDISYPELLENNIPEVLREVELPLFETKLPRSEILKIDTDKPTYIYNAYNLDYEWDKNCIANRILLLEPSVFQHYPMGEKTIQFILDLSKNINGIQLFVGEFSALKMLTQNSEIHYKEHPLNCYEGIQHLRDWMFNVSGYYNSFFAFWKNCLNLYKKSRNE